MPGKVTEFNTLVLVSQGQYLSGTRLGSHCLENLCDSPPNLGANFGLLSTSAFCIQPREVPCFCRSSKLAIRTVCFGFSLWGQLVVSHSGRFEKTSLS